VISFSLLLPIAHASCAIYTSKKTQLQLAEGVFKLYKVKKDGNCLPASVMAYLSAVYPAECRFETVADFQQAIFDCLVKYKDHWKSSTVIPRKYSSYENYLEYYRVRLPYLWESSMGEFMPSIVSFLMKRPLIVMEKTGDKNRRTVVEPFKTEHAVVEESQLRDPIFLLREDFHYDALIRATNPLLEVPLPLDSIFEQPPLSDPIDSAAANCFVDSPEVQQQGLVPTFPVHEINEYQREDPQMRALNLIGFQVLIQLY